MLHYLFRLRMCIWLIVCCGGDNDDQGKLGKYDDLIPTVPVAEVGLVIRPVQPENS